MEFYSKWIQKFTFRFFTTLIVTTVWLWVREKLTKLLSEQGPVPSLSNTELIMLLYSMCCWKA